MNTGVSGVGQSSERKLIDGRPRGQNRILIVEEAAMCQKLDRSPHEVLIFGGATGPRSRP